MIDLENDKVNNLKRKLFKWLDSKTQYYNWRTLCESIRYIIFHVLFVSVTTAFTFYHFLLQELFSKQKGFLEEELDYRKQALDQAYMVRRPGQHNLPTSYKTVLSVWQKFIETLHKVCVRGGAYFAISSWHANIQNPHWTSIMKLDPWRLIYEKLCWDTASFTNEFWTQATTSCWIGWAWSFLGIVLNFPFLRPVTDHWCCFNLLFFKKKFTLLPLFYTNAV